MISKAIDGTFPNYSQVIPKNNEKVLKINLKDFTNSVKPFASWGGGNERINASKVNIKKEPKYFDPLPLLIDPSRDHVLPLFAFFQ